MSDFIPSDKLGSDGNDQTTKYMRTFEEPPPQTSQNIQNTFAELRDKLLNKKYADNSTMNLFVKNWGDGFTYYMIIVVILVNVSLYVDVFVENSKAILGVHLTRIIFLLSVLIISIISLVKGWQSQEIEHSVNIITKLLYLIIILGYFIAMAVKLSRARVKIGEDIFRLIVSIALVVVGFVTLFSAIMLYVKSEPNNPARISMYYLLIVSALGIILSIISIIKSQTRISSIPGTSSNEQSMNEQSINESATNESATNE